MSLKTRYFASIFVLLFSSYSLSWAQSIFDSLKIKEYSIKAPNSISSSPEKLSEYLTINESSDAQKALNIYTWIIYNIRYDTRQLKKLNQKTFTVTETLRRKKGICYQFSALFTTLCLNSGIPAKDILGYSKGYNYMEGDEFIEDDHSWNAMRLGSNWYFVDATWGSGGLSQKKKPIKKLLFSWFKRPFVMDDYAFQQNPTFDYFLKSPQAMILDHLPADPTWQLLEQQVILDAFEASSDSHVMNNCKEDTLNRVDTGENVKKLNMYLKLSPNQYLQTTADLAYDYNHRNLRIVAEAQYSNALVFDPMSVDVIEELQMINESIKNYWKAVQFAEKHSYNLQISNKHKLKKVSDNLNSRFYKPLLIKTKLLKRNMHIISRGFENRNRVLSSYVKRIEKTNEQILRHKDYIKSNTGSLRKSKIPEKNYSNGIEFISDSQSAEQELYALKLDIDTLKRCMDNMETYWAQRESTNEETIQTVYATMNKIMLNESIGNLTKWAATIDSLDKKLVILRDSTRILKNRIQKQGYDCMKKSESIFQRSRASDYNSTTFFSVRALELKVLVQELLMSNQNREYVHLKDLSGFYRDQVKLINQVLKLLNNYEMKLNGRINFKTSKSIYQLQKLMKSSQKSIESLEKQKLKLEK